MDWLTNKVTAPDQAYYQHAVNRQAILTKPAGSLGVLEEVAMRLAAMQKTQQPEVERVWVSVFAADHGIAAESVSAFPQVVTAEMVRNFANKGAAVNVLSCFVNAQFEVIDVGLIEPVQEKSVIVDRAGNGTANFAKQAAMTESQMQAALQTGRSAVERALKQQTQLFIAGEMGIANTTSASAIAAALSGLTVEQLTGAGTGLDAKAIQHKAKVIIEAIRLHQPFLNSPLDILQYLGGFEIAALVGAYIYAAQKQIPVLIDGFISSVAALLAVKINPAIKAWFFYAHYSQEKGHVRVLEQLQARVLLDLNMRLGEGSGAVAAVPLLQMACKLHNEMATFQQAEIST
ncbi:MAG: nicotinate-nucleotide--dimethylbenzimidazole phosphoribosyltransferase [Methylococcales bacterium]|nr:nicotinate-nucleotide--dimethylbenzimidazole phosphoribosyltransferase [Methylococcales bacterium]